jgi:hypothetical protein
LDDEQQPGMGVLLVDEPGSDGAQLDVHRSSVLESADCVPPYSSCWSSRLSHKAVSENLLRDAGDGRQSGWV